MNGSEGGFRIVVGADEAGYKYKNQIKADFENDPRVVKVIDVGVNESSDKSSYAHQAVEAAKLVQTTHLRNRAWRRDKCEQGAWNQSSNSTRQFQRREIDT